MVGEFVVPSPVVGVIVDEVVDKSVDEVIGVDAVDGGCGAVVNDVDGVEGMTVVDACVVPAAKSVDWPIRNVDVAERDCLPFAVTTTFPVKPTGTVPSPENAPLRFTGYSDFFCDMPKSYVTETGELDTNPVPATCTFPADDKNVRSAGLSDASALCGASDPHTSIVPTTTVITRHVGRRKRTLYIALPPRAPSGHYEFVSASS